MFHRQDIHRVLKETALDKAGHGIPCKIFINHRAIKIDCEAGIVTFANGDIIHADLIIGADGIRVRLHILPDLILILVAPFIQSATRTEVGVVPDMTPAPVACYRCNISKKTAEELGFSGYSNSEV